MPKSFDDMLDKFNDDDDDDVMIRTSSAGIEKTVGENRPQDVQDKRQEGGDDSAAPSKKIASA